MIRLPHLETDITTACQLSCVACNHHVPLHRANGVTRADPAQIEKDLRHLSSFVRADAWGALGGEPLLHTELADIVHIVYDSGIAVNHIEVWTNGLLLPRMGADFWSSPFDTVVLSVYEGKHTDESLTEIATLCRQYRKLLVVKDERAWHNFRTLLEPAPTDADATRKKFRGCFFRSFSRVVNEGYFFTCCCAPHMPMLLQGRPFGSDGVRVEGLTEEGLRSYLAREEPLGACAICAGRDTAVPIQWHEERDPAKWIAASKGVRS